MSDDDVVVDVLDEKVVVEVRTHDLDRRKRPWKYSDLVSGRVTWGVFRNSRWGDLRNDNFD